ncbi:MAG: ABC transporter substrate-binding protein [Thermodesulfobacteriota bacterium]
MKWRYPINRRDFLKLSGAASLAMFGAPLWGARNLAEAATGDVFEEFGTAYGETIVTLDWHATTAFGNSIMNPYMWDFPNFRDAQTNELLPMATTGWEPKSDTVWRFHIRQGIKFWNGNKLTAKSFAFTQNRMKAPGSSHAGMFKSVEKVVVVDDYTVDVFCKEPFPVYPACMIYFPIYDEEYYGSNSQDYVTAQPMGSGPFIFKKWHRGIGVEMEVNKGYWMPSPPIKTLKYYGIQEAETRTASLLSGQTKIIYGVPIEHFDRIKKAGFRAEGVAGPRIFVLGMNHRIKPFDDVRVRKACNYAVDNRKIMNVFMKGMGEVQNQPACSAIFGYNPNLPYYDIDLNKARSLMSAAGYPNGYPQTLTLETVPGIALNVMEICEAVGYDLKNIGLKIKVEPRENADFRARRPAKTGDPNFGPLWAGSWSAATCDSAMYLPYLLGSAGVYSRNYDEEANKRIDKCNAIIDNDERLKELRALMAYFNEQCPFIWTHAQPNTYGMSNDHNFQARKDEMMDLRGLKKVKIG